ncbi:MAG: GxGYxYP domain-containing protein [candidate division KSB1 bacterium]|nr:GxGYxYP domain-containing protein [candidate division KSB1 bacterium]
MKRLTSIIWATLVILLCPVLLLGNGHPGFDGEWTLLKDKSSEIGLYNSLSLEIERGVETTTIIQKWGTRRSFSDTLQLRTDGKPMSLPVKNRVFPTNVFMGLSKAVGGDRSFSAKWQDDGNALVVRESYDIRGSQGMTSVASEHRYSLSPIDDLLTYKIQRSTRKTGPELTYVFKRAGMRDAYVMKLQDGWNISGKLPEKAFLISLQGVVNQSEPRLYFVYPDNYPYTYTESVYGFYKDKKNFTFTELHTVTDAFNRLKSHVKGYVVWDKNVRTSLIVAFTLCGLEQSVAVTEDMIPMMEAAGLKMTEDFRGRFTGQSDAEIYNWAYREYWRRCSKDIIIWMGGPHGDIMKPGVADWGIYNKSFFNDLSSRPEDEDEYKLANVLLADMNPTAIVMGWHSYAKDKERDHVKLTSSYGFRVEGLHTLPNMSFSCQVPASPGFKFTNNHNIKPGVVYKPEKKVYISCVQTDGLGIGAWLKPGRGEIPYAWEVIMNYVWMAPGMQEYFYSMATPNDYFIGCLSGPGYLYPKVVPPDKLPPLITEAQRLMRELDLNVFEIMDYSEGATVEGNTELTEEVVDAYYEHMPDAIGFLNGYAPAFTFTVRDKKPLISYDYYLSPTRPEADAAADLQELATINSKRPYFLLVHVRESSDVKRVKGIMDKLGPDFELVPLDIFLKMAGEKATFEERFLQK